MKTKKIFRKIFVGACSLVMGAALAGGVATAYNAMQENPAITADAADLGVIQISKYTGSDTWLGGSARVVFAVPDNVSGNYSMTSGTITLKRGDNTYALNASEEGFSIQNDRATYGAAAWIELWHFGKNYALGSTFAREAGDIIVINGTFSNGTDSFTLDNATIIVNSAANSDMYEEMPTINAGYCRYSAEWTNSWAGNYYPQMNITTNAGIPSGDYTQVTADAITFTRGGVVYNLPVGNYLKIGADNGGLQQVDFTLWPLGNVIGTSYAAQEGDVLTINGKFTNGTVTFEIQKTEITYLVGKPCAHSVVPVYPATYTDENGNATSSVEVKHNTTLSEPTTPTKAPASFMYSVRSI